MYEIHIRYKQPLEKRYLCVLQIQDGKETWFSNTLEEAQQSMIRAARTMNGAYIRTDDIVVSHHRESSNENLGLHISPEEHQLLEDIRHGRLVTLKYDDPLLKYRLTVEECEKIVQMREGRL